MIPNPQAKSDSCIVMYSILQTNVGITDLIIFVHAQIIIPLANNKFIYFLAEFRNTFLSNVPAYCHRPGKRDRRRGWEYISESFLPQISSQGVHSRIEEWNMKSRKIWRYRIFNGQFIFPLFLRTKAIWECRRQTISKDSRYTYIFSEIIR